MKLNKNNKYVKLSAALLLSQSLATVSSAALVNIFTYDADASTTTGSTPSTLASGATITDVGGGGNNGEVIGSSVTTVEDDPFSVAGQLSFSFPTTNNNRINTLAIDLLTVADVVANGGYTMSTHIKTSQTSGIGQFFGYAGTDVFRTNGGALEYRTEQDGPVNVVDYNLETISGVELQDGAWHEISVQFDTLGNTAVSGRVQGEFTFTIDGTSYTSVAGSFDDFGESLNRDIGVGGRSAGNDQFNGLLYNPSVSLGVVPEPSSTALLGLGGLALIMRRRR